MAAQTNYNYSTPKGVPGGKFDLAYDEVVTRINEEEDGKLHYGTAVAVGANAGDGIKAPISSTKAENIEGVLLHAANTEQDMSGKVLIKKGASVGVIKKGHVWGVLATGATPTYGAKAYVVHSGNEAGYFTDKESTGDVSNLDIGATFGNASDDGIAVIVLK